jgi:formylglycine-generating enzyme required for sulfatase activity
MMMIVIKTIKFDLPIDGVNVKTIEELSEHFTVEVLALYNNGMLLKWCRARKLDEEVKQLEAITALPPKAALSRTALLKKLCEIFTVDADDMIIAAALGMPPAKIEKSFPELKAHYIKLAAAQANSKTTAVGALVASRSVNVDWAQKTGEDTFGRYADIVVKNVTQRFRWIPSGSFLMGSPTSEPERGDNETQHKVTFAQGFWMADTACTQGLWVAVMGDNPAYYKTNIENPVEQVNWNDVQIFVQRLHALVPKMMVRLPSEAEWEYACRAGTSSVFSFGNSILPNQANYDGTRFYNGGGTGENRGKTIPVKSFTTNSWGLYQMHGNVWEWCQDCWDDYANTPTDGSAARSGDSGRRVLRGGSWDYYPSWLRSALRVSRSPGYRYYDIGFRVVISPPLADH